jgi:hypothetical protein
MKMGTIERCDVVLLYLLLEEKLPEHKHSIRVLVDGFIVNVLFDGNEFILVSDVLVEVRLGCAILIGTKSLEDGGIGIAPSRDQ